MYTQNKTEVTDATYHDAVRAGAQILALYAQHGRRYALPNLPTLAAVCVARAYDYAPPAALFRSAVFKHGQTQQDQVRQLPYDEVPHQAAQLALRSAQL